MEWLNAQFMSKGGPDLFADVHTEQELRDKAEIAKRTLSTREQTNVFVSAHGVDEKITLTRAEFDEVTSRLVSRTGTLTAQVMDEAGLTWESVAKVLLVGGSTRMRQVSELVTNLTGKTPSLELNPDEVVAVGAAIQGALLVEDSKSPEIVTASGERVGAIRIQDVTAHSLGVVVENVAGHQTNNVVLKRGTSIPASASDVLQTLTDNQRRYHCQVTEGEDIDLDYVRIVGSGMMDLPGTYPRGAPMEVAFEYDADGIIHVHVTDLTAQRLLGELKIAREANLSDQDVIEMQAATAQTAVE
jgi:molecular chaperone DnaK